MISPLYLVVMLYSLLQVSVTQSSAASRSPPSLLTIDIPSDIIEEFEERQNRERIYWRRRAREARDRRLAEERIASDPVGEDLSYPVVKATYGAVGDRRREDMEVSYSLLYLSDS